MALSLNPQQREENQQQSAHRRRRPLFLVNRQRTLQPQMRLMRDGKLIIVGRALRTFGFSFTSVILSVMLTRFGFSEVEVGIIIASSCMGSIAFSLLMGFWADRLGRKRLLVVASLLMAIAGLAFAFSHNFLLLLVAAFVGTISPSPNDNNAFSPVDQSILSQLAREEHHSAIFGYYNTLAAAAGFLGALVLTIPALLNSLGARISENSEYCGLWIAYVALALGMGLLFLKLSPAAEAYPDLSRKARVQPRPGELSRRDLSTQQRIWSLTILFFVDAFSGGMVVQTILAFWFYTRYGVPLAALGLLFAITNLLEAVSMLASARISKRVGLLKAMTIPHALANGVLILIPFMPSFPLAVAALLLRHTMTKMDKPVRQAFSMQLVTRAERTSAASLTTTARSAGVSVSPLLSGLLLSSFSLAAGIPLLLSGFLGVSYDVIMWLRFRNVRLYSSHTSRKRR
jgi:MFS family permease